MLTKNFPGRKNARRKIALLQVEENLKRNADQKGNSYSSAQVKKLEYDHKVLKERIN